MTIDEGYIKYDSRWTEGPAPDRELAAELERWRAPLFAAGLIGHYEDLGIGYGNLSVRGPEPGEFVISATQTGQLAHTQADHYSLVTRVDIAGNTVWSTGPLRASSETMTHAAIYALSDAIGAVVHVHSKPLWDEHLNVLPTTKPDVAYGTPAMAEEFAQLWTAGRFRNDGLAIMAGHEEGIVSVGTTLEEAAQRILSLVA